MVNSKLQRINHLADHPQASAQFPTVTFCTENKRTPSHAVARLTPIELNERRATFILIVNAVEHVQGLINATKLRQSLRKTRGSIPRSSKITSNWKSNTLCRRANDTSGCCAHVQCSSRHRVATHQTARLSAVTVPLHPRPHKGTCFGWLQTLPIAIENKSTRITTALTSFT